MSLLLLQYAAFANNGRVLITFKEFCWRLSLSPATVRRYTKSKPDFPQPIRLGTRSIRYKSEDAELYVDSLKLKGNNDTFGQ